MLRQYTISTRWLQAHWRVVGSPRPESAGATGCSHVPGYEPLYSLKSAMAGVFGAAGLRLAACACGVRMTHSAHAVASRQWRRDGRVGVMKIGPH
jgi:hypothetical protein